MAERTDDLPADVAAEGGYVTAGQLATAREGQAAAQKLGMDLALGDVLVSQKALPKDQVEEITRVVRVRAGDARVVGEHRILSKVGEGGVGVVFKAQHIGLIDIGGIQLQSGGNVLLLDDVVGEFR
jgi:hypothetical protein